MPLAVEHIRRMRGGAQSHLMRCRGADGRDEYFVVKFQNNPQHPRILVNELLATRLGARLGLPTPQVAVIEVRKDLIDLTTELAIQFGTGRVPCRHGFQFGSRYPGDPARTPVHDFLPDEHLREVENLADFAGMLVFDKWTCNCDSRQSVFHRPAGDSPRFMATMVDQGYCFNATEWSFPDSPLRGLYSRPTVYNGVSGVESFEPFLARLENLADDFLDDAACSIPPEWYKGGTDELRTLLSELSKRRTRVEEMILDCGESASKPFPNWKPTGRTDA